MRASEVPVFAPYTSFLVRKINETYRSILSLVCQGDAGLDQLALEVLVAELLPVGGDAALRGVDRPLNRSDQAAQLFFDFWLSYVIKVRMSQSLFPGQPIRRVQLQEANHELERFLGQRGHVSLLQRLRLVDLWEFETYEARVLVEGLHLLFG